MNKTILLGRLTKAPEIRISQSDNNTKIANFTLAVNRSYVKQGEERQADFINIVTFGKLAEFAEKYLDKGLQICLSGRIQTRNYTDNNNQKRYITEIIAEEIDFADSLKKVEENTSLEENQNITDNTNNTDKGIETNVSDDDDLPF